MVVTSVGALLLVAVALAGVLQARAQVPATGAAPVSSLVPLAGLSHLGTTTVPAPPASFGLRPAPVAHPGVFVLRPTSGSALRPADSQRLFALYLDVMAREGWTLLGKGDPGPGGDWTLRWQFQGQAALLSMFTSPRVKLEVDLCPPRPYC